MSKEICVVGLGYIGLPTAMILASAGNKVVGVDCNTEVVRKLRAGKLTFQEEGIEKLYQKAKANNIAFQEDYPCTNTYIIAVPTPYIKKNKKIDPTYIINAIKSVVEVCESGTDIVIESTVSPGTIETYIRPIISGKKINLVHAPERIIPGKMVQELKENNRIIGADDIGAAKRIKKIYSSFCNGEIVLTSIKAAEMIKVVENTFRDINIAFANELTQICKEIDLDVYEIIRIANMHPRVNILTPGPGVGGHCISVDPWFLVGDYPGLANLILAARKINDSMPEYVLKRLSEIMRDRGYSDYTRIGLYGITYKEDVNDVRESPTLQLLESMKEHLAVELKSYDPMLDKKIIDNQIMNFDEFISSIDIVVIMVGHRHIIRHQKSLEGKIIFDTKNVINELPSYHL